MWVFLHSFPSPKVVDIDKRYFIYGCGEKQQQKVPMTTKPRGAKVLSGLTTKKVTFFFAASLSRDRLLLIINKLANR